MKAPLSGPLTRAACLAALVAALGMTPGRSVVAADEPVPAAVGLAEFLASKLIDRDGRRPIEEAAAWDDATQQAAVRLLLRLAAPAELVSGWRAAAIEFGAAPPAVDDRLVAVRGRAVFVGPQPLTPEQREIAAGREHFDVVRIVDAAGTAVDVLVWQAPKAWARGRPIDESAVVFGLPLSTGVGPRPEGLPTGTPALVVATTAVSWFPETPLGKLGMDYALFDTVADGRGLVPGDTAAFYALLAACAKMPETPPGKPTDIVPLIDPAQRWFAAHRGDPVVIAGNAQRVIRVAIDDPAVRAQVGADHYWEVFVFVPTPPLSIDGRLQDNFPVVCCVRDLPADMPRGDLITEAVVVPGFALKRYAYPLADAVIGDKVRKGERRETPLVLGRRVIWQPRPSARNATDVLFAVFASLAGLVALALAWGAWSMRRDTRRSRSRPESTDRFDLPGGPG